MNSSESGKYLKYIFIAMGVIGVLLLGILIVLVVKLNNPSITQEPSQEESVTSSTSNTYIPETDIPMTEECSSTTTTELADDNSLPPYADDDTQNGEDIYYDQAFLDEIDTLEECEAYLAQTEYPSATIRDRYQQLLREEGSKTNDPDAQICIDKLNGVFEQIKSMIAENYIVINGTADTDAFQNSLVALALKFDLYSDNFMSDYAFYLSELSLTERLSEHVFTRCSYPYVPFVDAQFKLVENIYCNGSEVLTINDEKVVKVTIYTPDGDSYAYFKNFGDNNWKIYFTEFSPIYGNGITKDVYKNLTP